MTDSTAVNIDSDFILKKNKLILQRFSESMIKTKLLSWQIYVQKYPEEVEKNYLYKVWKKYADRIYAEIVFICIYPSDITSQP